MRSAIRISLSLLLLGLAVGFNLGLVDIRIEELNFLLGKVAQDQDVGKTLNIVAKYELIKRRMQEGGESAVENYELEARMQAVTSGDQFKREDVSAARKAYLAPVRFALNGIRLAMGKALIRPKEEDKILDVLEIGYFWERSRKYHDAVKIYDGVLKMPGVNADVRSAVLIHKAFCHSMVSEYGTSKNIYERVIHQYPETDAGMLSWKLLDFITTMEKQRDVVEKEQLGDFEKAKRYYLVMDYRNAVKHFSKYLQTNSTGKLASEARYYKGRSNEELGETEDAALDYRAVIRDDKSLAWAREANRRILMLGEFYMHQKEMANEAKKQLAAYQDEQFTQNLDKVAEMVAETSIRGELLKSGSQGGKPPSVDKDLMAMLDGIDVGDLTGEKEQQKKLEEMKARLEKEAGTATRAQVKDLKRAIALRENPFRKAAYIQDAIKGNAGELKYIYNKRLRAGVKISGKMTVKMNINADGSVGGVQVAESDVGDQGFEKEITGRVSSWKFKPVPDSLGAITINYPFEFFEEQ